MFIGVSLNVYDVHDTNVFLAKKSASVARGPFSLFSDRSSKKAKYRLKIEVTFKRMRLGRKAERY